MIIDAIVDAPLWWQSRDLYNGRRTQPTMRKLRLRGEKRWRRIHVLMLGNTGVAHVVVRMLRYVVPDFPTPGDTLRPWVEWNSRLAKSLKGEPC